jgi:hypothetical protein
MPHNTNNNICSGIYDQGLITKKEREKYNLAPQTTTISLDDSTNY